MEELYTRQSLLIRIRNADDERAWGEFVDVYTPLIYRFCASRGVMEVDRLDVMQEIFKSISRSISRFDYDRDRSTFRNWLFTVCRSKINNHLRSQMKRSQESGSSSARLFLENQPDPREEQDWETEYRRYMFRWAADKIRHEFQEKSWSAFWRTTVEDEPVEQVGQDLQMSKGAIWVAKSRIVARLREKIESVSGIEDPRFDV